MNIDNQLLLGLVFITAGIALALLAYAVLLNRRNSGDDDLVEEDEANEAGEPLESDIAEPTRIVPEPDAPIPGFEEPTLLIQEPVAASPAQEPTESSQPKPVETEDEPVEPPADTVHAQADESEASEATSVSLVRNPQTGRLAIQVGDQIFGSRSELKNTEVWEQIGELFEELHAWMAVVPPQSLNPPKTPKAAGAEPTKKAPAALSMVEEINEILAEKLTASATAPQGVHIAEGADGSIRVFIGVQGYAMDQVPNEEVRRLIREAVSEWESRA